MASATILHVGEDHCYRIPVMQHAGLRVVLSESSVRAVEYALITGDAFSAIAFQSESCPPASVLVSAARKMSQAPLILFENPSVLCDQRLFDLVIDGRTSPAVWLQTLRNAIAGAQETREMSVDLRRDGSNVRTLSRKFHAVAARHLLSHFEFNAHWRGKPSEK